MKVKGLCRKCLGCNRLENKYFEGTNYCKNFVKGEKGNGLKQKDKTSIG